jgi:hypothetical protein
MIPYNKLLWSREDVKRAADHVGVDLFWFLDNFFESVDLPIVAFRLTWEGGCPFTCQVSGKCLLGYDRPLMCHALMNI